MEVSLSRLQNKKAVSAARFVDIPKQSARNVEARVISVLEAPKIETFVRQVYFEGGDILVCLKGLFLFTFADGEAIELRPGEMLVIYPGNYVTIQSKRAGGRMNYVVLNGSGVSDYFDSFGFYDRMRVSVDPQDTTFASILRMAETGDSPQKILSSIGNALTTFQQRIRENGAVALNKAILGVHACLARGEVGIQSVCDELNVSRSYLNGVFLKHGLPPPGTFIRREQLRRACTLLRETQMKISEVGKAVGIASPIYFTAYIRRLTGCTPREIRAGKTEKKV